MKIQITDFKGQNLSVIDGDTDYGLVVQYTNKITGKKDPYVSFGGGRIVHFSTIESRGWYLKTDLGQIVTPHDLKGVNS